MARTIIDIHSHPLLPVWKRAVASATGQSMDNLRMFDVPMPDWSLPAHIAAMDRNGITAAVLSLPGVANLARGRDAGNLCRIINEEFAEIIGTYPGRFGAFAAVPLDDMEAALAQTAYALDVLKLDGVGIGASFGGKYLGDPRFDPLLEELNRRKAVLFVHPGPPPGYVPDGGIDVSILEFMFDTTRMLTNMVLSGAKRRFADIRIISTHGGGTIPYLAGRLSVIEPIFGAGYGRATVSGEDIIADLGSFHFDLTASTSEASMAALGKLVPFSRLMFGTDFAMMPQTQIVPALDRLAANKALGEQDLHDILSSNALRLLPRLAATML